MNLLIGKKSKGFIVSLLSFVLLIYTFSASQVSASSLKPIDEDWDLVEEVVPMPSVDQMTKEERKLFDLIVEEQLSLNLELNDPEGKELYRDTIVNFFDESSGYANDISHAESVLSSGEEQMGIQAINVRIGAKFVGIAFNVALGFAVGGGVAAIQTYIIKKGKDAAGKMFTKTVKTKIKAWGAPKLASFIGASVAIALEYADVGGQIAKQIDKRDKRPNDGWVDLY